MPDPLDELLYLPAARPQGIDKVRYSHVDMVDFIIANPWISQGEIAARYGYTQAWVSTILASDAFQAKMAERREEVIDPAMKATIEERFKALTIQSLKRLMEKLDAPVVSDNVALKAAELGAKALGIGGNASAAPHAPAADHLAQLANRLIDLQSNIRRGVTINGQAIEVTAAGS